MRNITADNRNTGFTIVELLIVIVVIGILAAIVIVAFNGVQARANKTAADSAAVTIEKKLKAFNSIKSTYPGSQAAMNTEKESEVTSSGITVGTPTAATGKNTVQVRACGISGTGTTATATGAQIFYWDYTASTPAVPSTPQYTVGVTTGTCTAI